MLSPYLAFPIYVAVGIWIILYARGSYSEPLAHMHANPILPQRAWAVKLFRGLAVVWILGGFLIISQGITMLPPVTRHRGIRMLAVTVCVAAAATVIVLRFTRREQERFTVRRTPSNEFFFEGRRVGFFTEQIPSTPGQYSYRPHRGVGHWRLVRALASSVPQHCYHVIAGQEHYFSVNALKDRHVLEVCSVSKLLRVREGRQKSQN